MTDREDQIVDQIPILAIALFEMDRIGDIALGVVERAVPVVEDSAEGPRRLLRRRGAGGAQHRNGDEDRKKRAEAHGIFLQGGDGGSLA